MERVLYKKNVSKSLFDCEEASQALTLSCLELSLSDDNTVIDNIID